MKGKKGDESKKGYGKGKYGKSFGKYETRSQHQVSRATAGNVASGCTKRASVGKVTCKPWRKFRVIPRVQWRRV